MNRLKLSWASCGMLLAAIGTVMNPSITQAASFSNIRIGDADGFGYGRAAGYSAANGGVANVDGRRVLGAGDFLPDLNENGKLATRQGDNFDYRTEAEIAGQFLTGHGFVDQGSSGSQFTDYSISTSYLDEMSGAASLVEERSALISLKDSLQENINQAKSQLEKTNNTLNELRDRKDGYRTQHQELTEKIILLKADIKELRAQNNAQNKPAIDEMKALKKQLSGQRNEVSDRIKEIKSQIDISISERNDFRTQRDTLKQERNTLQTSISDLKTRIDAIRTTFNPVDSRIPQPTFTFDFLVNQEDIQQGNPLFLNLLFADYDVKDAMIKFTTSTGSSFTRELTKQRNSQGYDGWIQAAFVDVAFDDIFTVSGNNFDGFLKAEVIAPDEPYLAFDFVELSTTQIDLVQDVPEPTTTLGLFGLAIAGVTSLKKQKSQS